MKETGLAAVPPAPPKPLWQLKKLTPRHKQAAALLAQGLGRADVARAVDCTPEYLTMLAQQPIFQAYVKDMTGFSEVRLAALFEKSVDVLGQSMLTGSEHVRLEAAKTVLKAVGKDGGSEKQTTNINFIVKVPTKAGTSEDWATANRGKGRVLENDVG